MSQVNIYDYKSISNDIVDVPILLHKDDTVYLVDRADIIECVVTGSTWVCGENKQDRGYKLYVNVNYDLYGKVVQYVFNSTIGNEIFTSLDDAKRKANEYVNEYRDSVVLADEIKPIKTIQYFYTAKTESEETEYNCFISDLGNNHYYIRPFHYKNHFLYTNTSGKDNYVYDRFIKPFTEKYNVTMKENYKPIFRNMYKLKFSEFTHIDADYIFLRNEE